VVKEVAGKTAEADGAQKAQTAKEIADAKRAGLMS